jgi:hypothetical protein
VPPSNRPCSRVALKAGSTPLTAAASRRIWPLRCASERSAPGSSSCIWLYFRPPRPPGVRVGSLLEADAVQAAAQQSGLEEVPSPGRPARSAVKIQLSRDPSKQPWRIISSGTLQWLTRHRQGGADRTAPKSSSATKALRQQSYSM